MFIAILIKSACKPAQTDPNVKVSIFRFTGFIDSKRKNGRLGSAVADAKVGPSLICLNMQ